LDGLKVTGGYWKFKEEALDCTLWRTRIGRGYGLVRQTTERITFSEKTPSRISSSHFRLP